MTSSHAKELAKCLTLAMKGGSSDNPAVETVLILVDAVEMFAASLKAEEDKKRELKEQGFYDEVRRIREENEPKNVAGHVNLYRPWSRYD